MTGKDKARVLGLMSGSSLDGLDAALVTFEKDERGWSFNIENSVTVAFPDNLGDRLAKSHFLDSDQLASLDLDFGEWIAEQILDLSKSADLIGIHGHTVRHAPAEGISLQIGDAEVIAKKCEKPTVTDFRNLDISLGGQGAPLVPFGEKMLFPQFDGFLNLGGICNGTFRSSEQMIAGDIGPFNQVMNFYAQKIGAPYDESGRLAKSGNLKQDLLEEWSSFDFFHRPFPKSLGNDWVRNHFLEAMDRPQDILATFSHFMAKQIGLVINRYLPERVLVTGGGAFNSHFIESLRARTTSSIEVPGEQLVSFKEALIFGFLALMKMRGENNVLASCTGASRDSSSGVVRWPDQN